VRRSTWAAVIVAGLGLVVPAKAQVFLGNRAPTSVINQPINTSNTVVSPSQLGSFSLSSFFHRVTGFGGPPTVGISPLPPTTAYQSNYYPNKLNPFVPMK
jgi:hypothetical protein